jgi:hypothetical protein
MSGVDVWINTAELADTFEHMRTWLDHNDCIPANFDVRTDEPGRILVVHVEFDRDDLAEAFQRDFGGASRDPTGERAILLTSQGDGAWSRSD